MVTSRSPRDQYRPWLSAPVIISIRGEIIHPVTVANDFVNGSTKNALGSETLGRIEDQVESLQLRVRASSSLHLARLLRDCSQLDRNRKKFLSTHRGFETETDAG